MVTVDKVLEAIEYFCNGSRPDIAELDKIFNEYADNSIEYLRNFSNVLLSRTAGIIDNYDISEDIYYIKSFLLKVCEDTQIYISVLKDVLSDYGLSKEQKYFIYYQMIRYNFLHSGMVNEKITELMDDLYDQVYEGFKSEFQGEFEYILREDRNKGFVIAFISQLLEVGHGPTTTLMDRCYILEKYLGKKVFIINTAEFGSTYKTIDWFRAVEASYNNDFNDKELYPYKDCEFNFYQCPNVMPETSIIREIINVVQSEKPYFIINVGGNSIVSDICSNIVPTLTVSTVFSGRTQTRGQFQAIARNITDSDRLWIKKHNLPNDHIIQAPFTFAFKEQKHSYTRTELGFPEDKMVVVLVGGRLDAEIDLECLNMLYRLAEAGLYIVFVGVFERYYDCIKNNHIFKENSLYMGFQQDVLAIDELCDIYVNPRRTGGGGAAVEALYKGVPALSLKFGDAAVSVGKDFQVDSFEQMYNEIINYKEQPEYYKKMKNKARSRAEYLMDSKTHFINVIRQMEKSDAFK